MKFTINPTIIYRTPRFPINALLDDHWEELKDAIQIASPDFYNVIKDTSKNDLPSLPKNIRFTIWKYFNRAKYRATPFGTFAGYGMFEHHRNSTKSEIKISDEQVVHEFIDWRFKDEAFGETDFILNAETKLISNSTYYINGTRVRYVAENELGFELCEEAFDNLSGRILSLCKTGLMMRHLVDLLIKMEFEPNLVEDVISKLIDIRLLFTDQEPNIIGQDYFERLNIPTTNETPTYLITEHPYLSGDVDNSVFKNLPALLIQLQQTAIPITNPALVNFKDRFIKKFEQREVPIMIALDPEMGVGYNQLEQGLNNDEFIRQFIVDTNFGVKKENLKEYINRAVTSNSNFQKKIIQTDTLPPNNKEKIPYANSFSAIATITDDLLILEHLGGATATSLLGRFTLGDKHLQKHCKSIVAIESAANPDVTFFDIAYMSEGYVDNINRRASIYDCQLSLLNFDQSKTPLCLSDMLISIQQDEVVIRSKSLDKRLIPRLASAYNYTRSDLPIFRLLCDIQNQSLLTNPLFKLEDLLPGLSYYPRLQFKNIVISPAKWRIKKDAIINGESGQEQIATCRNYLTQIGIDRYFKAGLADQTVLFDLQSDLDISSFRYYMGKLSEVLLQEAFLPENPVVKNTASDPFYSEFIINLQHGHTIYKGIKSRTSISKPAEIPSVFPPAIEWLYYEIYCHQQRSDQLLLEVIAPIITDYKSGIKQWFFIRYNEGGDHLRLRIQVKSVLSGLQVMHALSRAVEEDLKTGIIADLQLKSYKREMDRYHPEMIEKVEQHFHQDSNYVITLLGLKLNYMELYRLCVDVIDTIYQKSFFNQEEAKNILEMVCNSLGKEHHLNTATYKQINAQFKEYELLEAFELYDLQATAIVGFKQSLIETLANCDEGRRASLFIDLMHMHINRLFNNHQRTHEMIIYNFALKNAHKKLAFFKKL